MKKIGVFFIALILTATLRCAGAWAQSGNPLEKPAESAPVQSEIQKTINLLEDETKRAEVVRLLKLMEVLEAETVSPAGEALADASEKNAKSDETVDIKGYLQHQLDQGERMLELSGLGLSRSRASFLNVMGALAEEQNLHLWQPYFLKAFLWGLGCLVLVWGLFKKFGSPPKFAPEVRGRVLAALRYILWPLLPSVLLIISLLPLPLLSSSAPETTAALVTGFAFIHSLIQRFFITFGLLCVFRSLATALLKPDENGRSLINLEPVKSRRILHTLNVVAAYLAVFVFIKGVFLEHFVSGALYSLTLIAMSLPIPVYLTFRIIKMRRFLCESEAASEEEEGRAVGEAATEGFLEYQADRFIRLYWPPILIALVWLLEFLAIANPADAAERFVGRLFGTVLIIFLAALAIVIERRLMLKLVKHDAEGNRLLLSTDMVSNAVVWLCALGLLVSLWGLPIENILRNPMTIEIIGRAFAILVAVAALVIFLKFSNLAASWLMSSKELGDNRNLRTMLPLAHTVIRAMAVFVAIVVILDRLGVNIGPILAGAGILSLGVGMGAQTLVKDVINGIFILLMNTMSVGDYVTMGGRSGTVEFLGLRTARLRDLNGNLIIIPNSNITDIVNMTRDFSQEVVELSVPYDVDVDAMLQMARETAAELSNDPEWTPLMTAPIEVFGVTAFDSKTSTIRLRVNAKAGSQWPVGRELRLRLRRRTQAYAMESPWFTQNVIVHQGQSQI